MILEEHSCGDFFPSPLGEGGARRPQGLWEGEGGLFLVSTARRKAGQADQGADQQNNSPSPYPSPEGREDCEAMERSSAATACEVRHE